MTTAVLARRRWLALGVIATATLMVVLDASIINIALPHAQRQLGIIEADRHWAITAYALAFGGLLLIGGKLADFAGRKRTMVASLLGFAAASMFGGFADTPVTFFIARTLQGLFAAALAPAALALVTVTFVAPDERAKAFGIYGAVAGAGGALGLLLGGFLTAYLDWRWCMFINAPIAIGAALATGPLVSESRADGPHRFDIPGAVSVTASATLMVLGLSFAAEAGESWASPRVVGALLAAAALMALFVLIQARSQHPMLPLRIVADRNRGGAFLTAALMAAGMFGMLLLLTYYLQGTLGLGPMEAGLVFLPFSGGIVASAYLVARLMPRTGPKPLMAGGMALATAAMARFATLDAQSSLLGFVIPCQLMMSFGLGMTFVPLNSLALAGADPNDAGVASALLNATQQLGGAIGVALLNAIYTGHVTIAGGGAGAVFAGYRDALAVAGALFLAALLVVLILIRTQPKPLMETL